VNKKTPQNPLGLNLDRPLVVFDIEATGVNKRFDRIIDLAILKIFPDGRQETHEFRVNPEMPIPAEATAIHGITDADVKDARPFKDVARRVAEVLEDCDLAGYNITGYDIPLLCEEFARAGVPFDADGRRVVDAQRIFHKKVPRDLPAALAYYCEEMHIDAHAALGDAQATFKVLQAQLQRYGDLPRNVDELDAFCNPRDPAWVDRTGRLKWVDGEVTINFGKKQGQKLRDIVQNEQSFLNWMLKSDFPRDTLEIVRNAMAGKYPEKKPETLKPET
jgi:DNA polymerase III subunit epsilon